MQFNSYDFILMLLPAFVVCYLVLSRIRPGLGKAAVIGFSVWFYAAGGWDSAAILGASLAANLLLAFWISKAQRFRKGALALTIAANVLLLVYFKYYGFALTTINDLGGTSFAVKKLLLPLGISFFTFQQIMYAVAIFRGEIGRVNVFDYLCYILFFPKLRRDFGPNDGQIKLFAGQVFVADNIKEVIPEFLMLLKGVIDCPDLPLNVSRSFLQNDGYVKKISSHITKKVADKLNALMNTERETYEGYWDDIAPFVKYGCIREKKFYDQVKNSLLLRKTDGKYVTIAEYKAANFDKTDKKIYYTTDEKRQAASVSLYTSRGIDVAVMNTIIDSNFMSFLEMEGAEEDRVTFARVDADIDGLKEESEEGKDLDADALQNLFRKALGKDDLEVKLESLGDPELAAMVTEDEQMRRYKEMSRLYGERFPLPDRFTLVLNRRNDTVQALASLDPEAEHTKMLCCQVYDLARMAAQPLEAEEITAFLSRSAKILSQVAKA